MSQEIDCSQVLVVSFTRSNKDKLHWHPMLVKVMEYEVVKS